MSAGSAVATAAFAARIPRDVVQVQGPDAIAYLQGQLSQDIAGLVIGDSAWSFVLQPQGKVDAWFRVTRAAEDTVVIDVDAGWADAVVQRLERFKLRVKLTVAVLDWQVVAVRGARPDVDTLRATGAELLVPLDWNSEVGVDLFGPALDMPAGVQEADASVYEAWRVTAGLPRMGAELDERTIPAEAGVVDRSVSFTKGCYTGQELVARVDSRGNNTPRKLRSIVLPDGRSVAEGATVVHDGREVGTVTSAAAGRALAYVRRDVDAPADASVGDVPVRIEALPAG